MLDLQKMQTSALKIIKETFDPNPVIEMIHSIFSPEAEQKGVILTCATSVEN